MKVTDLSPVTADVTIAQATEWLVRNGWERDPRGIHSEHFDGWTDGTHLIGVIKSYTETWSDAGMSLGQFTVNRIAEFTGRKPAEILREMSEIMV